MAPTPPGRSSSDRRHRSGRAPADTAALTERALGAPVGARGTGHTTERGTAAAGGARGVSSPDRRGTPGRGGTGDPAGTAEDACGVHADASAGRYGVRTAPARRRAGAANGAVDGGNGGEAGAGRGGGAVEGGGAGGDEGVGRVARGGAYNMAGAVVGAGLNLALVVAVARGFSQEAAGLLFSATSVFLIAAAAAALGTGTGLVYFIARVRTLGATGQGARILRTALGPVAAMSVVCAAAMYAGAGPVAELIGEPDAESYVRLLAGFLPFAVLAEAVLAATRAHHAMRPTVLVDKVGRPLAQLLLVAAVTGTGSAGLLTVAWAGPYLPAALVAGFWLHRIMRRPAGGAATHGAGAPHRSGDPVGAREFWGFSLPRSVAGVAQIGIQRSGIVLVAALQGAAGAAVFTAGTRIMVAGQFATQAVQFAAGTRLAELLTRDDRAGTARLHQAATGWLICMTWPLFLPAIVYAPLVMSVFGDGYATRSGIAVLVVISAAQMLSAALGMGDLLLTMAGRTSWNLANNLLALAVNLLLCALLIPLWGTIGAAAAWGAAIGVRNLLPLWQLRRTLGVHPFSVRWAAAAGVALLWFGAVPLCFSVLLGATAPSLLAALAVGTAGWLGTLWRLRLLLDLDGLLPRRFRSACEPPSESA